MYTKSNKPKTQIRIPLALREELRQRVDSSTSSPEEAQALADAVVVAALRAFLDGRIGPA